ncbi:MAG: hypothetical protein U1G07_14130 [Verrucomicrobiota bacterium]
MSDFKFECPSCKQRIQIDVKHSGRQMQCPGCQLLIRVPPASQAKAEEYDPQSGMTWNTFVPGQSSPKGKSQ